MEQAPATRSVEGPIQPAQEERSDGQNHDGRQRCGLSDVGHGFRTVRHARRFGRARRSSTGHGQAGKSKACSAEADKQGLHGKARKVFRSKCKAGKA